MRFPHDLAGWFARGSPGRLATGFFSEAELAHEAGRPSKGLGPLVLGEMCGSPNLLVSFEPRTAIVCREKLKDS
jgi:hypothetical protein